MTKRVVEHKIKLEKSVKIILGVLALGVLLNAFAPVFDVRKAFAELDQYDTITVHMPGMVSVECLSGCK